MAVRAELTYGQQRRLAAAGLAGVPAALAEQGQGQQLTLDLAAYDLERLHTWLLDWSFKDGDGDHIVLTRERIEALHPDTAREINDALDAHIEALEAKKGPRPRRRHLGRAHPQRPHPLPPLRLDVGRADGHPRRPWWGPPSPS